MSKAVEKGLKVMQIILFLIGYGILIHVDWRIALGLFFVNWAINFDIK